MCTLLEGSKNFSFFKPKISCLGSQLVESKNCNNNQMTCNDDGCWFNAVHKEQFYWNYDYKQETYECSFHKKQIIAEKEDSQLYFSTSNTCKPKDLFCKQLNHSMVKCNQKQMSIDKNTQRRRLKPESNIFIRTT